MFGKIRRIISLLNTISITKTIYLNFKVFPGNIAKKLPIYVGKNVDTLIPQHYNLTLFISS